MYGLYYEETNYGGYGVTVRNMAAEPIAASVYWSNLSLSSVEGIRWCFRTLALLFGCSEQPVLVLVCSAIPEELFSFPTTLPLLFALDLIAVA